MKTPLRFLILLGFVASVAAARGAAPLQEILALAPELQDFAGSRQNFESLAGGLTSGKTNMLSTITLDGMRGEVIFTPAPPMTGGGTAPARVREAGGGGPAARGIASPDPRDIGAVLMGGMVATPKGRRGSHP